MCALAPWYGETLYSSGVMMGQVVRRMLLQRRCWERAGQISFFAWMDTEKSVTHKLPGTESSSFGIRILPPQVHHCHVLRKWTARIHLWRLQKPENKESPFYVPINVFSLSELCMFPSAGLVWQPSPELWNLHVWSVSRACQYQKTHHIEYCAQEWTPFSRCLYAHKWREIMKWCAAQNDDRVNCPMSAILSFLQKCLDCSCASSSLKVYVSVSQLGSWWIVQ